MKNMKYGRTLLALALVLVVLGSVVGGTIAWFTDEVTSTSNVIKSGTLDVTFEYAEEYAEDPADVQWKNADSSAIFDYKYWEPGYTQVRYVKVANVGDLAFEYALAVKPAAPRGDFNDADGSFTPYEPEPEYKLEDMIEVYVAPAAKYANFAEIKAAAETAPITIADMIGAKDAMKGVLLPAEGKGSDRVIDPAPADAIVGEIDYCIALHMKEEAGNEYQNLSISDGFSVQLEAKQYTYEMDDFGSTYDENAEYSNLPAAVVLKQDIPEGSDLEVAYSFRTTDVPDVKNHPELLDNPYINWHADFVVSFDKPVAAGDVTLAGQYDYWNENWLSFPTYKDLAAGEKLRLLGEAAPEMGLPTIYINYGELCALVQEFCCGAYGNENVTGTTMTVELRIYETEEPSPENGNSVNKETTRNVKLGTFTYTFD